MGIIAVWFWISVFGFMHHSPENRGHTLTTKNVHFVKLSKYETDFTIAFLSSRRSKIIYGMSNSKSEWRSYALRKMPRCREFRPKSGLPTVGSSDVCQDFRQAWRNLLGCLGLSLRREFQQKSEVPTQVRTSDVLPTGLLTYMTKNPIRIWPFGFRSELFQTRVKLTK